MDRVLVLCLASARIASQAIEFYEQHPVQPSARHAVEKAEWLVNQNLALTFRARLRAPTTSRQLNEVKGGFREGGYGSSHYEARCQGL